MRFYAVHALKSFRLKNGDLDTYPVYENVIAVRAASLEDATVKGALLAENSIVDDASLMINEIPAFEVFLGIRKIIELDENFPLSGMKITAFTFEVENKSIQQFLENKDEVKLTYID